MNKKKKIGIGKLQELNDNDQALTKDDLSQRC